MKTKAIVVVLLLMFIFNVPVYGGDTEAEHWEKVRQMEQLAERFKAETGFTGNVDYYLERMKLGSYEGKFADIPFSADADTTTFRQACNRVLDKILPYSFAKRSQLSMSRITRQWGYTRTNYYQLVNGYGVEGYGFIVITYDAGRNRFDIGDGAVELPDNVVVSVSSDQAINMAKEFHSANYQIQLKDIVPYEIIDLKMCNPDETGYKLMYIVHIPDIDYYIDARTGSLLHRNAIVDE
jgi:hypothetical protein